MYRYAEDEVSPYRRGFFSVASKRIDMNRNELIVSPCDYSNHPVIDACFHSDLFGGDKVVARAFFNLVSYGDTISSFDSMHYFPFDKEPL